MFSPFIIKKAYEQYNHEESNHKFGIMIFNYAMKYIRECCELYKDLSDKKIIYLDFEIDLN